MRCRASRTGPACAAAGSPRASTRGAPAAAGRLAGRCAILALAAQLAACTATTPDLGPLPVRNQHPAQLTVQHLDPRRAATLPEGGVSLRPTLAYTSLFLADSTGGEVFLMDGEVLRASVQVGVGLTGDLELTAELPMLHTTGGFLDGFLIGYHDLFSLPDQDRSKVGRNLFDVHASRNGADVYRLDEAPAMLADVPIALNWSVLAPAPERLGVMLRAGVELPTGDEDRGAGNGELDSTLGIALTVPLARATLHGHVQHTFAGTPDRARREGFGFRDVTSVGCAVEFGLGRDLAAVIQTEWETSALRELQTRSTLREQLLLWVGGRLRVGSDLYLEMSIGEDLRGVASPDVTFWLSLLWRG